MSIYRIHHNIEDFMFFTIDDLDVYNKMDKFDIDGFGQPLQFSWLAPKAEFIPSDSGATVLPDITQWNGTDLILNAKAKQTLNDILHSQGECYPLESASEEYWLFNPTNRINHEIIDLSKTKSTYFDDGSWKRLETLVFNKKAEQFDPSLFTLEIDNGVNLYCTDNFKETIETNKLHGLIFEEIS